MVSNFNHKPKDNVQKGHEGSKISNNWTSKIIIIKNN